MKRKPILPVSVLGLILMIFCLSSCSQSPINTHVDLPLGSWRGALHLRGGNEIPFRFEVSGNQALGYTLTLVNGVEKIDLSPFRIVRDTLLVRHPTFDSELYGIVSGETIKGEFRNYARQNYNVIPFSAQKGAIPVFQERKKPEANLNGKWRSEFIYRKRDTSEVLAKFQQNDANLSGTFLTPTGDYRYLNGVVSGDSLFLSTFDMAHAFLFKAKIKKDESLEGIFFSGDHWYESWTSVRDENFTLPSPDSMTFLKPGFKQLSFQFPNINKEPVSIHDETYEGKVVVVQIMGTWCPNCRDETIFLNDFYKKNYQRGFQVIALAYEVSPDPERALNNLIRMVSHFDIRYEVLLAGSAGEDAVATLPMLNHIMSYPTTVFIDRKGRVRRIMTGFNGPATGEEYEHFVDEFNLLIDKLIDEPA